MTISRRGAIAAGAGTLAGLPFVRARAQAQSTIKIGVLNDQSGT